jgi:hypothetical protein
MVITSRPLIIAAVAVGAFAASARITRRHHRAIGDGHASVR